MTWCEMKWHELTLGRATSVGGVYVGRVHFDFGSTLVRLKSDIIPTLVKKILKNMCDENFSKLSFSTLVELKCMHT